MHDLGASPMWLNPAALDSGWLLDVGIHIRKSFAADFQFGYAFGLSDSTRRPANIGDPMVVILPLSAQCSGASGGSSTRIEGVTGLVLHASSWLSLGLILRAGYDIMSLDLSAPSGYVAPSPDLFLGAMTDEDASSDARLTLGALISSVGIFSPSIEQYIIGALGIVLYTNGRSYTLHDEDREIRIEKKTILRLGPGVELLLTGGDAPLRMGLFADMETDMLSGAWLTGVGGDLGFAWPGNGGRGFAGITFGYARSVPALSGDSWHLEFTPHAPNQPQWALGVRLAFGSVAMGFGKLGDGYSFGGVMGAGEGSPMPPRRGPPR